MARKVIREFGDWREIITESGEKRTYNKKKYQNLEGNFVEKNPIEAPYTYYPYVIYKSYEYNKESDFSIYSDLIMSCIYSEEKINKALNQINLKLYSDNNNELFSWKKPSHVELLVSALEKKEFKCTAILEGCNVANGRPYWIVYMREK